MKTETKAASLVLAIIISASFAAGWQAAPTSPQGHLAVVNKVQLTIEGKVINLHNVKTVTVACASA